MRIAEAIAPCKTAGNLSGSTGLAVERAKRMYDEFYVMSSMANPEYVWLNFPFYVPACLRIQHLRTTFARSIRSGWTIAHMQIRSWDSIGCHALSSHDPTSSLRSQTVSGWMWNISRKFYVWNVHLSTNFCLDTSIYSSTILYIYSSI
jgi:hypothetical protein